MKKEPKLRKLKKSKRETNAVRSRMSKNKSVKITINIDSESLSKLKQLSDETGVPYQRMLNNLLKESLNEKTTLELRVNKIEKELRKLRKLLAA